MALEKIKIKHGSPAWLEFRKKGIGGSDAAAILGLSPFKTNVQVWEEKTGRRVPDDISDKPNVKYGKAAEELLIKLFALDYPQYKVRINRNVVYKRGFMFASLDAELIEIATGEKGFYEGKTTEVHSGMLRTERIRTATRLVLCKISLPILQARQSECSPS